MREETGKILRDRTQKQPLEVFCKKRCFWKFFQIHRKTPVSRVSFLIKLQAEAETLTQAFSCQFCEISRNTVFTEHLRATASSNTSKTLNIYTKFPQSFEFHVQNLELYHALHI